MFLIKKCSRCGSNVRFPIDRGRIRVNCHCGNSFIADPDNPDLYNGATFDLHGKNYKKNSWTFLSSLKGRLTSFKVKRAWKQVIRSLVDYSYKIQNFTILPSDEQRRIILVFIIIGVLILFAAFFLVCDSPFSISSEEWSR